MSLRLAPAFAALLVLISTVCPTFFTREAHAEKIVSFASVVRAQKDASLDVSETIIYDFEGAQKHGIYRDIPISYQRNGGRYSLRWKIEGVSDENGSARQYSTEDDYSSGSEVLRIRVGDKDTLISGVQTYVFKLKFWRAVNWFNGTPEVYWNATGNEWEVPMETATALFYPPPGTDISKIKTTSFRGPTGSTTPA